MIRMHIGEVRSGMILAKAVFNNQGDPLLRSGVRMTDEYIKMLKYRGFSTLFVRDSEDEEEAAADIVTERVRQEAYRGLRSVYEIGALAGKVAPRAVRLNGKAHTPPTVEDPKLFNSIFESIGEIIHDVTNAPLILNLNTLRTHDTYTFYHCIDMTIVAIVLGRKLKLSLTTLQQLAVGCMLHDIGKLFIPPEILNKPGKLEPEEWEAIRQHPRLGYEFLQGSGLNSIDLLPKHVALQHHERQDGRGYPRGLTGANELHLNVPTPPGRILPIAEIAAVADVYDALRADRPYRPAFPPQQIITMMRESAGAHLNSAVVETLLSVMPLYPAGSPIVVTRGPYQGYQGVAVSTPPEALTRPIIRLLEDSEGRPIPPVRLDLSDDPTVQISSAAAYQTAQ